MMKNPQSAIKKRVSLMLTATVFSYCSLSFADQQEPPQALQDYIQAQMLTYHIPGASIAVIKDYKIEWATGFGFRDVTKKEKVNPQTLFQAASISKPITAVAVMETFGKQKDALDANINALLKTWQVPSNKYTEKQPVTIRLLLSHTAGIIGFRYKGYAQNTVLPTLLQELNGTPPANTPPVTVVRQPGTRYEYCPAGYTILQQLLVDTYHESFSGIMHQLIFQPLKMTRSTFEEPLPENDLSNMAQPYLPNGKPMLGGPYIFTASAAGGLWTTPSDLARFLISIQKALAGKKQGAMTAAMVSEMFVPSINPNMGLGFEINMDKNGHEVTQGNYFGHSGFNSGYLALMVGSKTGGNGVIIMVNVAPVDMSAVDTPVQYTFLMKVIKKIATEEQWR